MGGQNVDFFRFYCNYCDPMPIVKDDAHHDA